VIVAIVSVVLFGAAAYAIDAGNVWQARRNMVTASDASALGAAGKFAVGQDGCGAATTLLTENRSDSVLDSCSPSSTSTDDGYVTVSGHATVPLSFAGLFGMTDKTVHSTTTARWGIPSGASGLRPIALCETATPALEQWLNLPSGPTGPTANPITITMSNTQPDACLDGSGKAAGNWGLAFGNGNNATSDTVSWLQNGYPKKVTIGSDIHANPGAFSGSIQDALRTLRDNGTWFPLPVFDRADGNGNNTQYHVVAFVFVQLVAFDVSGTQANRNITLNFDRGVIQGTCCAPGPDTGVRAVRICDVDTNNPDTSANAC
jgi:hypothetical protein